MFLVRKMFQSTIFEKWGDSLTYITGFIREDY